MKKTMILGLATFIWAFASCDSKRYPVGKNVYTIVSGFAKQGDRQVEIYLDLADEQRLVLYPRRMFQYALNGSMPNYEVGDTVWVHYGETARRNGELFLSDVLPALPESMQQVLIERQKEFFQPER